MFLPAPVTLTLWTRGNITERLPWEVLESICDHCEEMIPEAEETAKEESDRHFASNPVPLPAHEADLATFGWPSDCHGWPDLPLIKHEKNRFVLSMTHICRSWRLRLIGLKRLWREIVFSADPKPTGIQLASFFLTRVADNDDNNNDDISLHIYAGLPFSDVLDPATGALLSKLREKTHRWERFFYWGRLGPYRSYLDLPAPRLRYFSDHNDLCHLYFGQTTQLFAGHTPILKSLVTSALGNWQPASLINLQTFDLWDCAPRLSMESVLSVLRYTPQLEEINIVSPNPPLIDCPPDEVIDLPHLKNLKLQNPDFYAIIRHFAIPNAEIVHLYSSSNRGADGPQVGRAFQTVHPFVGLASVANLIPMFGQPVLLSSLDAKTTLAGLRFIITITMESGAVLCVDLEWTGGFGVHARLDYIRASMSALAEMPFVSPSSLRITASRFLIDYNNPLFRLDTIKYLVVEDIRFTTTLHALSAHPGQSPLLPKLQYLFFPEDELDMQDIREIPEFLQYRKNLTIVLGTENQDLIQGLDYVCVIEGGSVTLGIKSTLA